MYITLRVDRMCLNDLNVPILLKSITNVNNGNTARSPYVVLSHRPRRYIAIVGQVSLNVVILTNGIGNRSYDAEKDDGLITHTGKICCLQRVPIQTFHSQHGTSIITGISTFENYSVIILSII